MDSTNNSGIDEFRVSVDAVVAEISRQRDDALARLANAMGQIAVLTAKLADTQKSENT